MTALQISRINKLIGNWGLKMLEKVLRINPEIKYGHIFDLFKIDYKVILDDNLIFRATNEARDLVEGSERG